MSSYKDLLFVPPERRLQLAIYCIAAFVLGIIVMSFFCDRYQLVAPSGDNAFVYRLDKRSGEMYCALRGKMVKVEPKDE